jgi:hypothetical protein
VTTSLSEIPVQSRTGDNQTFALQAILAEQARRFFSAHDRKATFACATRSTLAATASTSQASTCTHRRRSHTRHIATIVGPEQGKCQVLLRPIEHPFDIGDILPAMDGQLLRTADPDGAQRYRTDVINTTGAILAAACKLGLHALYPPQSRAFVDEGEVRPSCPLCAATSGADHCWKPTVDGASRERAELDDALYLALPLRRTPTHSRR